MQLRLVRQRAGDVDHEILWASVGGITLGGAVAWLRLFGPPPLVCPFRLATGLPCPTCGSTRALAALVAGHLARSLALNPAVLPGCIVAVGYMVYALIVVVFRLPRIRFVLGPGDIRAARWGVLAAAALLWSFLIIEGV
jgi:hypothetical protein